MIEYKLIKSARSRRRTTIRINHQGEVEVRSPKWTPKWMVDSFVKSQTEWIIKNLEIFNNNRPKRKLIHGSKFPFFGQEFALEVTVSHKRKKVSLEFMGDHLWASVPADISEKTRQLQLEKSLIAWYKKHCLVKLWSLTEDYCNKLDVKCNSVRIKNHRTRWGSCSSRGNINYNWRLALAPIKVAEYVVIHEVCHLLHHHHGKSFWQLVASLDPNYKQHIKWLKQNHHQLELY